MVVYIIYLAFFLFRAMFMWLFNCVLHFHNLFSDILYICQKYVDSRYKNNRHCNRLIAEGLDPDGKVSPVQVSNKLRQLGLRVPSKKRMIQPGEVEGASGSESNLPNKHELKESSVLRQTM